MAVDEGILAADFRSRGYSYDVFVDPPGQKWLGFIHAVDEIVVPLEGSVTVIVNGHEHRPAVGEEIFIPAAATHDVITAAHAGSRWAYGYKKR